MPKYVVKGKPKVILLGNWHPTNVTFCRYVESNEARSAIGGRVWGHGLEGAPAPPSPNWSVRILSKGPYGEVLAYADSCVVTAVGGTWPYFLTMARDMEVREMFHSLVNKGGFVPFVKNLAKFIVHSS